MPWTTEYIPLDESGAARLNGVRFGRTNPQQISVGEGTQEVPASWLYGDPTEMYPQLAPLISKFDADSSAAAQNWNYSEGNPLPYDPIYAGIEAPNYYQELMKSGVTPEKFVEDWANTFPADRRSHAPQLVIGKDGKKYVKWDQHDSKGGFLDKIDKYMPAVISAAMGGIAATGGALGGSAGAASGALEGAGAFGGEALGAAANAAGAYGGAVAPWTAGAGALGTGATAMDWGDILEEVGNFTGGESGGFNVGGYNPSDPFNFGGDSALNITNTHPSTVTDFLPGGQWSGYGPGGLVDLGGVGAIAGAGMPDATLLEQIMQKVNSLPSGTSSAVKNAISKVLNGEATVQDMNGIASVLTKLGVGAAAIAGLFEGNNNPLIDPMRGGMTGALTQADKFAGMPSLQQTDSQRRAIALANDNVGDWKPYIDKADAMATEAAGGLTEERINALMNPYLRGVLDPMLRDIEEASARRRQQQRAITSRSGNDFQAFSEGGNRFNVQDQLLDRETLRAVSDASGKAHADAWNTGAGLATKDLDRILAAGKDENAIGRNVGVLGAADVAGLQGAGALEQQPQKDALAKTADSAKLYTDVVHGNTGALASVGEPSKIAQVTGALGALKTANEIF